MSERIGGMVRWFRDDRGYGFITSDTGADVFVHHTAIEMKGHRTLTNYERVEFEVAQSEKGLIAVGVQRLGAPPAAAAPRPAVEDGPYA